MFYFYFDIQNRERYRAVEIDNELFSCNLLTTMLAEWILHPDEKDPEGEFKNAKDSCQTAINAYKQRCVLRQIKGLNAEEAHSSEGPLHGKKVKYERFTLPIGTFLLENGLLSQLCGLEKMLPKTSRFYLTVFDFFARALSADFYEKACDHQPSGISFNALTEEAKQLPLNQQPLALFILGCMLEFKSKEAFSYGSTDCRVPLESAPDPDAVTKIVNRKREEKRKLMEYFKNAREFYQLAAEKGCLQAQIRLLALSLTDQSYHFMGYGLRNLEIKNPYLNPLYVDMKIQPPLGQKRFLVDEKWIDILAPNHDQANAWYQIVVAHPQFPDYLRTLHDTKENWSAQTEKLMAAIANSDKSIDTAFDQANEVVSALGGHQGCYNNDDIMRYMVTERPGSPSRLLGLFAPSTAVDDSKSSESKKSNWPRTVLGL